MIALDGDDDGDSDGDGTCIARARHLMADFLGRARADHGMAVSTRAVGLAQLVVSELVTNAHKYAPGPLRMELRIVDDAVEVTVRDGVRVLPVARPVEPGRVGQHGLEIVMAVVQAFQVRLEPAGKSVTARIALTDGSVGPR
ncbi:ATP-binding protein [Streptomyces geranii]|uniref:ATP-binding protein n=1 Tax=Streptomyces geranii TaxID=2058923 RepID=UPI000D0476C2|nr:ATP-binding protein [Streptomyces geranii]